MIRVCAWCKKRLGEKAPYTDKAVTHGICKACAKKQLKMNVETVAAYQEGLRSGQQDRLLNRQSDYAWFWVEKDSPTTWSHWYSKGYRDGWKRGARNNPGARWHDSKQREADQLDRAATKKWQQDFYHGKSVAHSESALAAKSLGMNPRLRETLAARYRPGKGLELSWGNEARLSPPRIRFVASRGWVDIRQSFASPEDWEQVVADAMQHPNTWAKRSASLTNPRRPHGTFRSCVRQVSRQRPRARDPKAVCGATLSRKYPLAQWEKDVRKTKKMPPFQPRPGRYRTRKNPIAIYGLGNPRLNGRINAKIEGVIYNRVVEVKAQKTGYQPGYYRHTFSRKNQVKIFGLDNGDLLLHSTAGVKLWQPD